MEERQKQIYKTTIIGGIINCLLLAFKFVAGFLAGSAAMIADAVHSFSDFITDIVVLVFVKVSGKPQDKGHDYGHGKYETLATTIIGFALLAVAVGILYNGSVSLYYWIKGEDLPKPGTIALWAALLSIVLKEITFRYTEHQSVKYNSPALHANAWHHRSDALSSIGTAVGIGGAIILGDRWTVLDPIASIVVGVFIVKVSIDMMKSGVDELMESSLPDEVENEILEIVSSVPQVKEPHHLRTRRIGGRYAIEMHIRMNGDMPLKEAHEYATRIESAIKKRFGDSTHVTIHTEPAKD